MSSRTLSVTDDKQRDVVELSVRESAVRVRLRAMITRIDLNLIPVGDEFTLACKR